MRSCWRISVLVAALFGWTAVSAATVWTELPALPEGLAGFAVWESEGRVRIAGGTSWRDYRKTWSDAIWELDEEDGRWRQVGRLPEPRAHGGAVARDGLVWLAGGHGERGSSAEVLYIESDGESRVVARLPAPWRFAHGAKVEERTFFLSRQETPVGDWEGVFAEANPVSGHVRKLAPVPGAAWILPAVASAAGRVFVAGGAVRNPGAGGGVVNRSEVHIYDPATNAWSQADKLPEAVRGAAAVALGENLIYVAGGFSDARGMVATARRFDLRDGASLDAEPLPIAVMLPGLLRVGDRLYCLGGEDGPERRSRRVFFALVRDLMPR